MAFQKINCIAILAAIFAGIPQAHAFKILSPQTEGCHERMLLGSLDNETTGFMQDGQPSTAALLAHFVARIPVSSIPTDSATQGLITEMTNRYGWGSLDLSTRFVLASFVAGVRAPDTNGFSIVDINAVRETQIRDNEQSAHFLRMKADDYAPGNVSAIANARSYLTSLLTEVSNEWQVAGPSLKTENWTFAFYGLQSVTVFGPAYDLGAFVHGVQDSYAHTIRDSSFNILAVSNYIEVVLSEFEESRDGPAHSERLDQCNLKDDFDVMRITEVRKQTATLLNEIDVILQSNSSDFSTVQATFDTIFAYKAGCDLSNQYCGSAWAEKSSEGITKPYSLGCGQVSGPPPSDPPKNKQWPVWLVILAPLAYAIKIRFSHVRRARG